MSGTKQKVLACPKCSNVWVYGGSAERATCSNPDCRGKVPVDRYEVDEIDDILVALRDEVHRQGGDLDDLEDRVDTALKQMRNWMDHIEERMDELEANDDEFSDFEF